MNTPSTMRTWAQQLLSAEAATQSLSEPDTLCAERVLDRMRIFLNRLVGTDGFTALLRRALAQARKNVPSLERVTVTADGHLEGLQDLPGDKDRGPEEALAITAHLLGLLVTFIGESLARRLIRDAWPNSAGRTTGESEDSK